MKSVGFLFFVVLMILSGCTPAVTATDVARPDDKLTEISALGTPVIATHANYEPHSKLLRNSFTDPNTKCSSAQYTANQMPGSEIDVALEVAHYFDVEPCFVTPPWNQLGAENWGDHWDMHVGSVAIAMNCFRRREPAQILREISKIIAELYSDETLKQLSLKI